jgi:starch-binding outer membrane protein, SusD/RagB family
LYNAYEATDKRLPVAAAVFMSGSNRIYYTRKYIDPDQVASNDAGNDWMLYRYADLLLLYAEALNETNSVTEAQTQLNKVRARAGVAAKTGLTQITARTAIELERRLELSCEGHRWFDLVRTDRVTDVMTAHFTAYPITESTGAVARMQSRKFLYPVPDVERTINPNLTQNEGYY